METNIYRKGRIITPRDCIRDGKIGIPNMVATMIDTYYLQNYDIITSNNLQEDDTHVWIIVQYLLEIERLPLMYETVDFVTQPISYSNLLTLRKFWIEDQAGKMIVKLDGIFALMDLENRKIIKISPDEMNYFNTSYERRIEKLPKLFSDFDLSSARSKEIEVSHFDIDKNGHANNTSYLIWAFDSLSQDFLSDHVLQTLNIKFDKEVSYGESLISYLIQEDLADGLVQTKHELRSGEKLNCRIECLWQKQA